MKRIFLQLATVLGASLFAVAGANAQAPSTSLSFGYDSHYMFRGVNFGENSPWVGLDMTFADEGPLSFNIGAWYIHPTNNATDELDLYAFTGFSLGIVDISAGGTYFHFADDGTDTFEFGFTASIENELATPSFSYFYDIEAEGSYFELALSKEVQITDGLSLDLASGISWGESYYGVSGGNHIFISATLPIALNDMVTLNPYIAGSFPIDALSDTGESDQLYGGISMSIDF